MTATKTPAPIGEELSAYLLYYLHREGAGGRSLLRQWIAYDDWPAAARREIARRMLSVLEMLDNDALVAMANGDVALAPIFQDLQRRLDAKQ